MATKHLEDLELIKPRKASNILLWGITIFMLLFVIWASLTELDRTVRSMGRVVPSSQLQILSNPEGGIIEDILVKAGDQVKADQELIRLDSTLTGAEFGGGESPIQSLELKISRLRAELSGRAPNFIGPDSLEGSSQIRTEKSLYLARIADRNSNLAAANARLQQAQSAVGETAAAYQARLTAKQARQSELELVRPLVARGIEARLTLMQAESAAAIASSEAAAAAQSINRARASVSEARAALSQVLSNSRTQIATELAAAQAELDARRQTLPALAARVERTIVRAPLPGLINRVLVNTRGGTVAPGQPLIELVPSDDSLVIEAKVRPQDIASVRLGQDARVAITAYDRTVFGTLPARVVTVSPDSVTDEQSGEVFYIVRVRTLKKTLSDSKNHSLQIGAGMVAEVDLLGEKRTIMQYLLTPITKLSETAFRE